MISAIFPLHIFIFGNHSLLFLSFNSSPQIKKFIDFLILQIDHDLACPSVPFQFHFWKGIFQHKKPIYHIFFPIACWNGNVSRIYIKDYQELIQEFLYTHSDVLTPVEIARKNEIETHFVDFKLNILAAKGYQLPFLPELHNDFLKDSMKNSEVR